MVDDHAGFLRARVTKRIKTGHANAWVYGCFQPRGMSSIGAMHTSSHMDAALSHDRQCDDARRLLPGLGHRGITRTSGFITISESDLALIFLGLQGCKGTFTVGACFRISETFA